MAENQDLDRSSENLFGFTKVDVIKLSYEWKIYDYCAISRDNGVPLKSPQFSSHYGNIKWCLSLYPNGYNTDYEDYLSLFLRLESNSENLQLETNFQLSILNKNREKCFTRNHIHTFIESHGHGTKRNVLRSKIMNDDYLPNGCLTIVCDITTGLGKIMTKNCTVLNDSIEVDEKSEVRLLSDYGILLKNQKLCDLTIVISDKKLYAHKVILAAHSQVFMNMFINETMENCPGIIVITDIEYKVFEELLRFIYSGKIENMETVVFDLLVAANKYLIKQLLIKCEQYLLSVLNIGNVIDILVFADDHNVDTLRINAIAYFLVHKRDIVGINNFDFLDRLKPWTVKEMLRYAIQA